MVNWKEELYKALAEYVRLWRCNRLLVPGEIIVTEIDENVYDGNDEYSATVDTNIYYYINAGNKMMRIYTYDGCLYKLLEELNGI